MINTVFLLRKKLVFFIYVSVEIYLSNAYYYVAFDFGDNKRLAELSDTFRLPVQT